MDHTDAERLSGMATPLPKIPIAVMAHASCSAEAITVEE